MFKFFGRKKESPNESIEKQRLEVLSLYDSEFAQEILDGDDCDQIANGFGPFGSKSNPIPVNGPMGEIKYLGKLRVKTGKPVFFHRIGSFNSPGTTKSVDVYEVVAIDGSQWANVSLDMYHPRRSDIAPDGFQLIPVPESRDFDLPFGFGTNELVANFPYGLPEVLDRRYKEMGDFGGKVRELLAMAKFTRPS